MVTKRHKVLFIFAGKVSHGLRRTFIAGVAVIMHQYISPRRQPLVKKFQSGI